MMMMTTMMMIRSRSLKPRHNTNKILHISHTKSPHIQHRVNTAHKTYTNLRIRQATIDTGHMLRRIYIPNAACIPSRIARPLASVLLSGVSPRGMTNIDSASIDDAAGQLNATLESGQAVAHVLDTVSLSVCQMSKKSWVESKLRQRICVGDTSGSFSRPLERHQPLRED